jgi:hypothetical protein
MYKMSRLSQLPIDAIQQLFENVSRIVHKRDRYHAPVLAKCNNLYNVLREELPTEHARLKEFQRQCYRIRGVYDVPNPPNPSFKLLKDCPEYSGADALTPAEEAELRECERKRYSDATRIRISELLPRCNCGMMHEVGGDDPSVILAQPHAEQLFANCSNVAQCLKLYNVLRKQYPAIDDAQRARLKEYRAQCHMRAGIDLTRVYAYDCPEYGGADVLTELEERELMNLQYDADHRFVRDKNIRISELFPRCDCGNIHYGVGMRNAMIHMDYLREKREYAEQKRNMSASASASASASSGGKGKSMRKKRRYTRRRPTRKLR